MDRLTAGVAATRLPCYRGCASLRTTTVLGILRTVASDAVWTALISGGAATLSGGVGWLTARQQSKIELAKLKQERDPGTAEDRMFRQGLYLRYIERFDAVFRISMGDVKSADDWLELINACRQVDDELELFGKDAVVVARAATWDLIEQVLRHSETTSFLSSCRRSGRARAMSRSTWIKDTYRN